MYISEAHAADVWPIGMSAGVINYKHKTISDRSKCANNLINTFDFNIPTYLDNMENELQTELSAWPFRYYVIDYDNKTKMYKFSFIPNPSDSEFDLTELIDKIEN